MMKKVALIISLFAGIALQVKAQDNSIHTPKGAIVKILTSNPGDKIKLNDVVTFQVVQKTDKDSVLFSTYAQGRAVKIQVQASNNAGDLMDALTLLTTKDSALVKVPTDSIFKGHEEQRPAFLPKGSNLVFTLKIDRVQSLQEAIDEKNAALEKLKNDEIAASSKYIADHKLVVKTTPSGLKYFVTKPSIKRKPLTGDTLLVNYTGRFLDGKVFDSSVQADAQKGGLNQPGRKYEPLQVVLGGGVIQGWTEALLLMNEGSKAQFIIPSSLGYGTEGYGDIPPYSTLVFDLELVKVRPIKHAAATKPPIKKHTATKKKS